MKIAYVYDAVYPYIKGGAEKRIYETGRQSAARVTRHTSKLTKRYIKW